MVELECIFDQGKLASNKRTNEEKGIEECDSYNLGTKDNTKMVGNGKVCNSQERENMHQLLTESRDVISWSYKELKTYDPNIITHDIILKPDANTFFQMKKLVKSIIEPLIVREL